MHVHTKEVEKGERKRKKEVKNLTLLSFGDDEEIEEMESSGRTPLRSVTCSSVVVGWTKARVQQASKEREPEGDEGIARRLRNCVFAKQVLSCCRA